MAIDIGECRRHPKRDEMWRWVRCAHYKDCFVVESRCDEWNVSHIDYVQDLPGSEVKVQDGCVRVKPEWSPYQAQAERDKLFNALVAQMLRGELPDTRENDVCLAP